MYFFVFYHMICVIYICVCVYIYIYIYIFIYFYCFNSLMMHDQDLVVRRDLFSHRQWQYVWVFISAELCLHHCSSR